MSDILVVEDDLLAVEAASDFLTNFGHVVHIAPDPASAVRQIRGWRPLVVLMDRRLPPPGDDLVAALCDALTIPLMDLADALCLIGRCEHGAGPVRRRALTPTA